MKRHSLGPNTQNVKRKVGPVAEDSSPSIKDVEAIFNFEKIISTLSDRKWLFLKFNY